MAVDRRFPQVRTLRDAGAFRAHLGDIGVDLGFDDEIEVGAGSPLGQPVTIRDGVAGELTAGNRFAILPMEGWDGDADGRPTDLVRRRWRRFGAGGAKLLWCEATAVRDDGRANPRQLMITADTVDDLAALREEMVDSHREHHATVADLVVGLQLTHSGRWSRPEGTPRPRVAYRHPLLDPRVGVVGDDSVWSDDELDELAGVYVEAAGLAHRAGFHFVDVKSCHGYLSHELLSAVDRPGRFGGDLEGRTRFLRTVIEGIRASVPGIAVAVRVGAFDLVPFRAGADGIGEPESTDAYRYAFGGDGSGLGVDVSEPVALVDLLASLGVRMVCVTGGSPYYNPHVQRPALTPPSDGYRPPEDPLVGVARMLDAAASLKAARPEVVVVGSGYSYLQEWLAHVAQARVRAGAVDVVGLGRMALSYPALPADVLAGRPLDRRHLCRTFSDCTTAPRHGMVSGCYPLDDFYRRRPERARLLEVKRSASSGDASGD